MEWLHVRQLFNEVLSHFSLNDQISIEHIAFCWFYDKNLSSRCYKPSEVFKNFSFVHLFDINTSCVCLSAKSAYHFLDPLTLSEYSDMCKPTCHVRTMDLQIVQHPLLRTSLQMGLNYIPLKPTLFRDAIKATTDAFCLLYTMLGLHNYKLDLDIAILALHQMYLSKLQAAAQSNKFGLKSLG
jgi:hypothetical protein